MGLWFVSFGIFVFGRGRGKGRGRVKSLSLKLSWSCQFVELSYQFLFAGA